jgi:hypothetical protein
MLKRVIIAVVAVGLFAAGYAAGASSPGTRYAGASQQGAQPGCQTFPQTGKTVCGRFLRYWLENGGLRQQGYPISGEFQERSDLNGQTYTVQYFERAVFEHHPENQPPNDVLLSQLGTFEYRRKYGSATPAPAPPPAPPGPQATPTLEAPIPAEVGELVRRNGLVFSVVREDIMPKRVDIIYRITNETGGPIGLVLSNADQHLYDNTGLEFSKADPGQIASVTLSNGQSYNGGTTFNVDMTNIRIRELAYQINKLPRIGNVRVRIPLENTP